MSGPYGRFVLHTGEDNHTIMVAGGTGLAPSLSGCKGYLCGPPIMVEATMKTLMSRRLFPRDIYREEFFNEGDKAGGINSPLINR